MKRKPIFGTREWAVKTANCIEGCANNCKYCYAKSMAIRFHRRTPETWAREVPRLEWIKKACQGRPCRVMFPSTHDITPANIDTCMAALRMLLDYGHELLIVTKAHRECMRRMVRELRRFRDRILFRITIGSALPESLSFWEPEAPRWADRWFSLMCAHREGFRTSVSCEPMLDCNAPFLVKQMEDYVTDTIWLGKANQLRQRLRINGADEETIEQAAALMALQDDAYIGKLYEEFRHHPKIRWKESIKKVVGLSLPDEAGLDQ